MYLFLKVKYRIDFKLVQHKISKLIIENSTKIATRVDFIPLFEGLIGTYLAKLLIKFKIYRYLMAKTIICNFL